MRQTRRRRVSSAPAQVNVHGGCDSWPEDVAGDWLARATGVAARFLEANPSVGETTRGVDAMGSQPTHLRGVSFETHRGRILGHPFVTRRLLEYLEPLRLTADISHWHVVAERLLDDPASARMMDEEISPFVDHVHARVGGAQRPQVAHRGEDPASVAAHARFWKSVWTHAARRGAAEALATAEYGPPPYQVRPRRPDGVKMVDYGQSQGGQSSALWHQIVDAKGHLEVTFEQWRREAGETAASGDSEG